MKKNIFSCWNDDPQSLFHSHLFAFGVTKPLLSLSCCTDQSAMNCPTVFRNCKNCKSDTPGGALKSNKQPWQPCFPDDVLGRVVKCCVFVSQHECCFVVLFFTFWVSEYCDLVLQFLLCYFWFALCFLSGSWRQSTTFSFLTAVDRVASNVSGC